MVRDNVLGKSLCNTAMYFAYDIPFLQDIQLTNVGKGGGGCKGTGKMRCGCGSEVNFIVLGTQG